MELFLFLDPQRPLWAAMGGPTPPQMQESDPASSPAAVSPTN